MRMNYSNSHEDGTKNCSYQCSKRACILSPFRDQRAQTEAVFGVVVQACTVSETKLVSITATD